MAPRSMSDSADAEFTVAGLLVDADRDSPGGSSAMDSQSRSLLVAVIAAWTGFLGLIAIVTTENAVQKSLGAVAFICAVVVIFVGLRRVVGDRTRLVGRE